MEFEFSWPNDFGENLPNVDRRWTEAECICILRVGSNVLKFQVSMTRRSANGTSVQPPQIRVRN